MYHSQVFLSRDADDNYFLTCKMKHDPYVIYTSSSL